MTRSSPDSRCRIALIGPTWPFRGGIAHHTSLLARALHDRHDLRFISFSRMYPRWLFPGSSDREPGERGLQAGLDEPLLDGMNPLSWFRVARELAAWRPEAVIIPWWVVFWAPQTWVISRHLRRAGIPVIFLCHNVDEHESSAWRRLVTWRALGCGSAFLCHSEEDLHRLRQHFPDRICQKVVHPSYGMLSRGRRQIHQQDSPELLFFGFIRPYKGLDVLLAAMPEVYRRTGARLRVVGEVWGRSMDVEAMVDRLGLRKVVELRLSYVPNEEIPDLFAQACVTVLPYRQATASGPLQLALGAGRPVVASAVGSLAEMVRNGHNGLLVPPGDPAALADAIVRALEPTQLAALTAGAEETSREFGWERLVQTLEEVVHALEMTRQGSAVDAARSPR